MSNSPATVFLSPVEPLPKISVRFDGIVEEMYALLFPKAYEPLAFANVIKP
jgi:hypothetical protein